MNSFTVFACEAQPIVVEGLRSLLSVQPEFRFVGSAASPSEALPAFRELWPDIVLVDQAAGLRTVLHFVSELKASSARTHVVLWVQELPEVDCFRALQSGARGVLRKTLGPEQILDCLRTVARGGVWIENAISHRVADFLNRKNAPRLTPREREIVLHVCRGLRNREIAEELSITPGTVKVHLMHIFEKTGVKDRFELAMHGGRLLGTEIENGTLAAADPGEA